MPKKMENDLSGNALVAFNNAETDYLTRKVKNTSRGRTHKPVFNILDFLTTVSKNPQRYGLKVSDPVNYFNFGHIFAIPEEVDKYGSKKFKDGMRQKIIHGRGARDISPFFEFRFFNGQYHYCERSECFGKVSIERSTFDQQEFLASFLGWINKCAPNFARIYDPNLYEQEASSPDMETVQKHIQNAEELAAQEAEVQLQESIRDRITQERSQNNNQEGQISDYDIDLETVNTDKPEYDIVDEASIKAAAEHYNFTHRADVIAWGRAVKHAATQTIHSIQAEALIVKQANQTSRLQQSVDHAREQLIDFQRDDFLAQARKGLSRIFKSKIVTPKLSAKDYLNETLKCFQDLAEVVEADIEKCLEQVSRVEIGTEDVPDYGRAIEAHRNVLKQEGRKSLRDLARKQQQGNRKITNDRIAIIRVDQEDALEDIGNALETWNGFDQGIENYIACKYSQYENLKTLKKKINNDFTTLLRSKLGTVELPSPSADIDTQNKQIEENLEALIAVVDKGREIIDELDDVIRIGQSYDIALVEGNASEIRLLSRKERFKAIDNGQMKLLPPPSPEELSNA